MDEMPGTPEDQAEDRRQQARGGAHARSASGTRDAVERGSPGAASDQGSRVTWPSGSA